MEEDGGCVPDAEQAPAVGRHGGTAGLVVVHDVVLLAERRRPERGTELRLVHVAVQRDRDQHGRREAAEQRPVQRSAGASLAQRRPTPWPTRDEPECGDGAEPDRAAREHRERGGDARDREVARARVEHPRHQRAVAHQRERDAPDDRLVVHRGPPGQVRRGRAEARDHHDARPRRPPRRVTPAGRPAPSAAPTTTAGRSPTPSPHTRRSSTTG